MMPDRLRRGGALALFLTLALPASGLGRDESLVGQRVVARSAAVLRLDDGRFIDANQGHPIYRVVRTADEWLWLASERQSGWAKPSDVVPLDRALDYYTGAIKEHPDSSWAYAMRGLLYEEMKEPGIALADYNEALRLDPKDSVALLRRGAIRLNHKRDPERAVIDLDETIRLDPGLVPAYALRANAHASRRDFDRAVADYTEAIRLDPNDTPSYHGRAIAWQVKGNLDRALLDLDELIRLQPDNPVAFLDRGNLWSEKRELDKAIADYTEAIRLRKEYVLAYNNRGTAWRTKKEYDKALSDLNVAIRLAPRDAAGYLDRGLVWKKMGEFERALDDYNQATKLDPKCAEAFNGRAWVQATCPVATLRDGKAAYEAALRSCELTEWKAAHHLDTLAASYAESRDFQRAVDWQTKALDRADDSQKEAFHARLQLYQAKKPYRDTPVKPAVAAESDRAVTPAEVPLEIVP